MVLAYKNLRFLDTTATINAECPFANCRVAFDATVWSPQVGMKLGALPTHSTDRSPAHYPIVGKVNLCSPDHVSLLVHRTFNVSIPRHHIPSDNWEFEYGPAENDPEFGAETGGENGAQKGEGSGATQRIEDSGRWVHKITATKLGDSDGYLEFTVVGSVGNVFLFRVHYSPNL